MSLCTSTLSSEVIAYHCQTQRGVILLVEGQIHERRLLFCQMDMQMVRVKQ
jgi:hypothetical protein